MAGGIFIAAGLVLGPVVGLMFGQTSLGLIAGGILGVVAAVLVAVRDSRR